MPILLVAPACDVGPLVSMTLPLRLASFATDEENALPVLGDLTLSLHELVANSVMGVTTSTLGQKAMTNLFERASVATGTAAPSICDLTSADPADHERLFLRFLTDRLSALAERQATRIATLSRSVAVIRQVHDQTQAAFARLEKFVLGNNLATRTVAVALLAGKDMAPLLLTDGKSLVQRLPITSAGLSDVSIFIEDVEFAEDSALGIEVTTVDDSALRGRWMVTGAALQPGQVRLSLPVALEADAMTPAITVSWHGEGAVSLAVSLLHPDPRFQVTIGSNPDPRVLAMRCWSYFPGTEAPIPANGILPLSPGAKFVRQRVLDTAILQTAVNMTPDNEYCRFLPEYDAFLVHPMGAGTSVAMIPAALPLGTCHIDARIITRSDLAGDIDYAIAIAPAGDGAAQALAVPGSEQLLASPWVSLKATDTGEVHLPLAAPLGCAHSLFLMTRLATQPGDRSWGWATFDRIRLTLA